MSSMWENAYASESGTAVLEEISTEPRILPPYHVVLIDDDDHTYAYVIKMIQDLFAADYEAAYELAVEVDMTGRAILDTTTKERAEFKRDQVHAFGPDHLLDRSAGSMTCVIEPAVLA